MLLARAVAVAALLPLLASAVAAQDPAGTLVLRNTRFDRVQVEVRVGASTDCAANPSVGTRTLARAQGWAIVSARVVCWRREADPGDATAGWTNWSAARAVTATKREVVL